MQVNLLTRVETAFFLSLSPNSAISNVKQPAVGLVFKMPFAELVAATLTVTLTTADDAVWLVPYTASSLPDWTRTIHATLFVGTLELLAVACVAIAALIERAVLAGGEGSHWATSEDVVLSCAGAALCWTIAIFLFARKLLKRRKKRREVAERVAVSVTEEVRLTADYGAVEEGDSQSSSSSSSGESIGDNPEKPSPWTVVTLTTLGALDEVSYFPALLVGKVFSPFELCFGTFLAACIILAVVTLFLVRCKPVLDFFDKIPLYGIVALFSTILTVEVIYDIVTETDDER